MTALRDAGELLWPAVRETLQALDLKPEDEAAAKLAECFARTIDDLPIRRGNPQEQDRAWALRWIGPLLLDTLEQLGATPAARARIKGGKTSDAPVSQIAKIRAARRA